MSPKYERQFSDSSFGFRPERNAHKALHRCRKYIAEGYRYAIDMDMEKFFDTVSHSKPIEILSRTIDDGRVIPPIHSYLNAGAVVDHGSEPAEQAVPQGGPLSPLLSNIMLNELDKELTERGHRLVRYADDTVVLCRSRRGAGRVKQSITDFIEKRLSLKVNNDKPQAVFFNQIKFLGYSLCQVKGNIRFRIHQKSIVKLRDKIKLLTSRGNGWGYDYRKERLIDFIKGWANYFKYADIKGLLPQIDECYRRRLRMVVWKLWERGRARFRKLVKLGTPKHKVWEYANTGKSYWRAARSYILSTSLTNDLLKQAGYLFFSDYYKKVRVD